MLHKLLERRVQALLRAAYILLSFIGQSFFFKDTEAIDEHNRNCNTLDLEEREKHRKFLIPASRNLALFQHHDGITGTSRNHVMDDYKKRLTEALKTLNKQVANMAAKVSAGDADVKLIQVSIFILIQQSLATNMTASIRVIPILNPN